MRQKISQLTAFLIFIFGISAMVCLTGARMVKSISPGAFLTGMAIAGIIMYIDSKWIDKHFIDGEWT